MSSEIKPLPSGMSFSDGNVAENWKRFKQKLDFYLNAHQTANVSNKKKIGILMTALGDAGLDVYNTFTGIDAESSFEKVIECFDNYCTPRKNTVFERFTFSQLVQQNDSVDAYVVRLKNQARKCEFHDVEFPKLVRDRLVVGISNAQVRAEMLRDPDLTLDKALTLAKAWEKSDREAADMTRALTAHTPTADEFQLHKLQPTRPLGPRLPCPNCPYEHRLGSCPAKDKECNYCHKMGHFASVCRRKASKPNLSAATVTPESSSSIPEQETETVDLPTNSIEVLNLYSLAGPAQTTAWYAEIRVRNVPVCFKIDSGAQCNTLLLSEFTHLVPRPPLLPTSTLLRPYGDGPLIVPCGQITVDVLVKGHSHVVPFFVVDFRTTPSESADNILGLPTIETVGLVKRTFTLAPQSKPALFTKYYDRFDHTLGDIPGTVSLALKPNTSPVAEKPRRFPITVKKKLCEALVELVKRDVICKVDEPTEWVSNLIAVTKPNGSLRVCLDPKHLNAALIIPKCEIPKCDDIFAELHEKRYFTVFDLKDGFWQIKLDTKSSYLTTFNSPIGRFRWRRLVMGISSAPEIFMNRMRELFSDLRSVYPYFDDLIVAGTEEADHDTNLEALLQRARQVSVKFNINKVQYKQTSVTYLGFQVSQQGVQPLPKHAQAITDMPQPTDRNGVLRFLGMVRYLARFVPSLATNTEHLRTLTHKNVEFHWSPAHNKEFQNLKLSIQQATSLRFYQPNEPLFVQTDSSKSGIGCCLYQTGPPVAYASRALSRTEEKYAQIEKELLAVVFSLEKFHDYTYGRPVTVFSDHRPLVAIVKKSISDLTPRLQRLRMRLLRYNFTLLFQPGKELHVADTLSRAYLATEPADESYQHCEVHCCSNVVASPKKLQALVAATNADDEIQRLKVYLRGGWPKNTKKLSLNLRKYRTFADNLTFRDNLLFFQHRLVIPTSLIKDTLSNLHAGHLNVQKTKRLARNTVFWLNMSSDIDMFVASCETCNTFRRNNTPETLKPFPIPTRPWQRLHTDICTHNSVDFLIIYDAYSQWLEIFTLRSKSVAEIITHCKSLFARFGVPSEIVSDNVPYNSTEWLTFASSWNFAVLFSSPRYPQSNGASEKAVGIAKTILRKNIHLHYALLQYRNAPIPHLGYSPAQLLMSRSLNSRIPVVDSTLLPSLVDRTLVHDRKLAQQTRQKYYYNRGTKDLPPCNIGDEIYYKKDLQDANWHRGEIVEMGQTPRSYRVQDSTSTTRYLRNRRFIHKPLRYRDVDTLASAPHWRKGVKEVGPTG